MRFKMYNGGGYGLNGLTPTGGPIAAPLYLQPNPTNPLHAVTKEYVDQTLGYIQAASITGNIPSDRLPGFTGSDISSNGYGVFALKPTGVIAGTYNKVVVNSKGFVVSGELVDYSVLTDVQWDAITADKPSTLEGYGITDALRTTGGVMSGPLFVTSTPTQTGHVVNKQYVDQAVTARETLGAGKIGDIVQTVESVTPVNHLRTNGAILDQASYAALYAIIGDRYGGVEGSGINGYMGQPWRQQYAFNTTTHTAALTWTIGTSLPTTVYYSQAIVTKNRVYLLGGLVGGSPSSVVHTAPINSDGTLGTWIADSSLPTTIYQSQAIVTKNWVYLMGGYSSVGDLNTVYAAPINADGTLGAWTTGTPLPNSVYNSQAIVTKNRVYLLGGHVNGGQSNAIHTAPINADGTLGTWTVNSSLPASSVFSQVIVTKNRVYLLGGNGGNSVYTAPISVDGILGTWTTGTSLPAAVSYSQAIVTKDRVYLLGGIFNGFESNVIHTAPINADGTLGTWTTGTPLPNSVYNSQAIVTKDRTYLLGGYNNGSDIRIVYTANFTGGTNDYLTLIANNTVNPSTQFKLPDTTLTDLYGIYSYIRAT